MEPTMQKFTKQMTRSEVSQMLREIANSLDTSGVVDINLPEGQINASVPELLDVKFKYKQETGEAKFGLKLKWSEAVATETQESVSEEPAMPETNEEQPVAEPA